MSFANEIGSLGVLFLASVGGGYVAKALRLPPLLGMLLAGIAVRNLPGELLDDLPESWSVALRLTALAIILLRAGLGLDLPALIDLRVNLVRLAVLPNMAEAAIVAASAIFLLEFPVVWALLLGFVISAVSPAVVVPSMLELQEGGYGVKKGIPSMILAAASFDDVVSITGFGVTLSLIFAGRGEAGVAETLLRAPIELVLGLGFGVASGFLCIAVAKAPASFRFAMLSILGLVAIFGGWAIGFTGGGSLATMTMGAVASQGWHDASIPVARLMGRVWAVAQPVLFGLIGAAVALAAVEPAYITRGVVILALGLTGRLLVTYLSTEPARFTTPERRFIAAAWIPKATVQAAVGALALDLARQYESGAQAEVRGTQVVTIAVLAIVITAPLGAIAIARTGPRWLQR